MAAMATPHPFLRAVALLWGLGGIVWLLGMALGRLTLRVFDALQLGLDPIHWAFGVLWIAFMAYSEGYRGFQLRASPRFVSRAFHLASNPRPLHLLLAPLFCMGYFHGSRKRLITSWVLTFAIIGLVQIVHRIPQPWRGVVDAGVVVGLGWGVIAMLAMAWNARGGGPLADPQLPLSATQTA